MVGWMAICINSREVAQGIYFNQKKKKNLVKITYYIYIMKGRRAVLGSTQ